MELDVVVGETRGLQHAATAQQQRNNNNIIRHGRVVGMLLFCFLITYACAKSARSEMGGYCIRGLHDGAVGG
jgi:hypothetical protein